MHFTLSINVFCTNVLIEDLIFTSPSTEPRERLTLFFKTLTLGYWSDLEYRTSATLKRAPATEKKSRVSIKKSPVYNFFPGYCSCSDTHNISLFFE